MATIIKSSKPLATQPIKTGQALGAILASLGLERSLPLIHGAQGCSAFAKIFFIHHFHEPMPLQSTAMDPVTTVMGSDDNIVKALDTVCQKNQPKLIVLMSSGVAEAQGCDLPRAVKLFRSECPRHDKVEIVSVNTPDFYGSFENGFSALLEALVDQLIPHQPVRNVRKKRVNLLLSHMLSPGDVEQIRSYVEAFGLQPVLLPDLSHSLDGHLMRSDYTSVSQGGADLNLLKQMGQSAMTVVIGPSLQRVGQLLESRTGVPCHYFPHLMNLQQTDGFIDLLRRQADRLVPDWIERQRGQLLDAMIDTHIWVNGRRFGLAAEADLLGAWLDFAQMVGLSPSCVVAPVNQPILAKLPVEQVLVGDLEDLADQLRQQPVDMMMTNAHGAVVAERLGLPLIRIGFPIFDQFGAFRRLRQGYAGMRDTLFELGNLGWSGHQHKEVYHSIYKQPVEQIRGQAPAAEVIG